MIQSIAYKSVPVKNASLRFVKHAARRAILHIGIDIGKKKLFVVVRWVPSRSNHVVYENPWLVKNPDEIPELIRKLRSMSKQNKILVGLESTGTYGDPLRQALADAGFTVHQLRAKLTHDYAEIFDGVPSQHDGKDAAAIAELLAQGKSTLWPFSVPTEIEAEMKYLVTQLVNSGQVNNRLLGKIEGLVARYWPELPQNMQVSSKTSLKLLKHYGGPAAFRADRDVKTVIIKFSSRRFSEEKILKIIEGTRKGNGVRQTAWDVQYVKEIATKMLDEHQLVSKCKKRLKELIDSSCNELQRLAKVLGVGTASVVWCNIGDPRRYHCADAWIKAMGLNLTERSSGEYQSAMRISKRGDSETRRWLYMTVLRWTQKEPVKQWYLRKKLKTGTKLPGQEEKRTGGKAVIAVMRKLMKGLYHALVHDVPFDPHALFFMESSQKKDAVAMNRYMSKRKRRKSPPKKRQ
jgi:transposase